MTREIHMPSPHDHFQGKTALQHIAEIQSSGVSSSTEIHGAETPGPLFALLDAARDTSLLLACLYISTAFYALAREQRIAFVLAAGLGWALWKGCRSALLAWSRLARLHRIAEEELQEIETNRQQEKEELLTLYSAKGFQGPLLNRVVDVLMADQDRLLRVMLQEEMGYRLEEQHHPIIQGLWAGGGALVALSLLFIPAFGTHLFTSVACMTASMALLGAWFARLEKNPVIPAFFWNLMIGSICCIAVWIFMEIFVT